VVGFLAFAEGTLLGLSLIVAIGPQNLYVLRQAMSREYVVTVIAICSISDAVLIAVGIAGGGAAITGKPGVLEALRAAGAVFLFGYAVTSGRRAWRGTPAKAPAQKLGSSRAAVVATCLGFTWLNPGVYLDTVLLIGTVASTWAGREWWFGVGAALASGLWFAGLGLGAQVASRIFAKPAGWRALDAFSGAIVALAGARLLFKV
jgi:L-lysine exporter family protein LysE/ArgO